jgi:23S rRNA (pseudouridine1915-N3)-methyltransferase
MVFLETAALANEFRLIAVGKLKAGPETELFARYNARLRPKLLVTEIADGTGASGEIKRREADGLLAALPARAQLVVLDLGGPAETSEAFAARFGRWREDPRPLCFMIGGAEGLDRSVIARADHVMSLGQLTWPHMLVRVMLIEQLFRAQSILAGHPYHRAGRPE